MRGGRQITSMQDDNTVREYEKAKRLGAAGFYIAVRNANPHLTERFNEVDDKLTLENHEVA